MGGEFPFVALGKHRFSSSLLLALCCRRRCRFCCIMTLRGGWAWSSNLNKTMSCLFYSGCSHLLPFPPSSPKARKNENIGKGKCCKFQEQVSTGVLFSCNWSCMRTPLHRPLHPGAGWGDRAEVPRCRTAWSPVPLSPLALFANNETVKAERIRTIRLTFHSWSLLPCLRPLDWS